MSPSIHSADALTAYVDALNRGDTETALKAFTHDASIEDPIGAPPVTGPAIKGFVRALTAANTRLTSGEVRVPADVPLACVPLLVERDDAEHPGHRIRISQIYYAEFAPSGAITRLFAIWGPHNLTPTRRTSPRYTERPAALLP